MKNWAEPLGERFKKYSHVVQTPIEEIWSRMARLNCLPAVTADPYNRAADSLSGAASYFHVKQV